MTHEDIRRLIEQCLPGHRMRSATFCGHPITNVNPEDIDVLTVTRVVHDPADLAPPVELDECGMRIRVLTELETN
jgi:hypothetical protein